VEVMIRDSHAISKRSADSSLPAPHTASTTVLYLLQQQTIQSFSAARKQAHRSLHGGPLQRKRSRWCDRPIATLSTSTVRPWSDKTHVPQSLLQIRLHSTTCCGYQGTLCSCPFRCLWLLENDHVLYHDHCCDNEHWWRMCPCHQPSLGLPYPSFRWGNGNPGCASEVKECAHRAGKITSQKHMPHPRAWDGVPSSSQMHQRGQIAGQSEGAWPKKRPAFWPMNNRSRATSTIHDPA